MATRPKSDYPCTQLELYAVLRIAISSYRENIVAFNNFKGYYDDQWGNDFEAAINAAAELPDFQARDEASESALIDLEKKGTECANKWQDLKRYITSTTGWGDKQKPKQEAAGSTVYRKAAGGNWEVMNGLMTTASNFITNNLAALKADQNMPNPFQGEFDTLKGEFSILYDIFTDKTQDQEQETDEKVVENNAINGTGSGMLGDGQAIYREDASMADRFTFNQILKIVRGSHGVTKTIDIAPESREFFDRVIKNSDIINIGNVNLTVEEGDVPAPTGAGVTIAPGEEITRPEASKLVTVFNEEAISAGQFTIRVMVD